MADEEYLGELPDSPPMGVFTYRKGMAGATGPGGSYEPEAPPGSYVPPSTGNISNVGYEVLVLAGPDYTEAIALITQHQGLMLSRELSADGAGSITLNRDAPLFYTEAKTPNNLIPNPNFDKLDTNPASPTYNTYRWGWMSNSRGGYSTQYGTVFGKFTTADKNGLLVLTPGTGNAKVNTLEGKSGIVVIPGTRMTITGQAKPATTGRPTRLYAEFYDADGVYMWTSPSILGDPVQTRVGSINYLRVDGMVPPEAAYASIGLEISSFGTTGEEHYFDNFEFYVTPEALPFFDGRDKSDILDKENMWRVTYDGLPIHDFIGQVRSSDLVNASESRAVTIGGPGTAVLLKRAIMLPVTWVMRDGKPWLVPPIKMLRDDFTYGSGDAQKSGGIEPAKWNKGFNEYVHVESDTANFANPHHRLTLSFEEPGTKPMIATGPWNLKYGAHILGDKSQIVNSLYFAAYPYLLPTPTEHPAADFRNVYEILIDQLNRAYFMINSHIDNAGAKTHQMWVRIIVDGTEHSVGSTLTYKTDGSHRFLRFRHHVNNTLYFEYGPDGINWTIHGGYSLNGSGDINPLAQWQAHIEDVAFRFYCYGSGLIHAYFPVSKRRTEQESLTNGQGYYAAPGTTLQPVYGGETEDIPGGIENPALSQIAQINDNDEPDASPEYDQMGYFKVLLENAQTSEALGGRGALPWVTIEEPQPGIPGGWSTGNFKIGAEEVAYDSVGNKRRGLTETYWYTEDGVIANPAHVAEDPVGSGKYMYTNPENYKKTVAIKKKVGVVLPAPPVQNFYDYFIQCCGLAHCDWSMRPGVKLEIYDADPDPTYPGTPERLAIFNDRTETVLFHEGYSTLSKTSIKSSEQIVNYVVGHDSKGTYLLAKSDESIAKWGLREALVDVDYSDPTTVSLQTVVNSTLAKGVNEIERWEIQLPVMDELRPFVDYKEGDWISIAKHTGADPQSAERQYDKFRVMAISLSVGVNGEETVELTLSSLLETVIEQLTKKMANTNATTQVAMSVVPPASSRLTVTSMSLDTLANVSDPEPITGSYLKTGASGVWVSSEGRRTSYTITGLGDNSTTHFEINHELGTKAVAVHAQRMDNGLEITGTVVTEEFNDEEEIQAKQVVFNIPAAGEDEAQTLVGTLSIPVNTTPPPETTAAVAVTIVNEVLVELDFAEPPAFGNLRVVVQRGGTL